MATKKPFSRRVIVNVFKSGERLLTREFLQGPVLMGRQPGNDLILEFPYMSRNHCQLVEEMGHFYLVDLGSQNGITFDGKRVTKQPVYERGRFSIEDLEIEIQLMSTVQPGASGQEAIETVVRRKP